MNFRFGRANGIEVSALYSARANLSKELASCHISKS
jgi:hypothetical protein